MKTMTIKIALGLSALMSVLTVTSSASAQTLSRWVNAKNTNYGLGVSGGATCEGDHGDCWLNDGQQIVIWNTFGYDQVWSVSENTTATVRNNYDDSTPNALCLGVSGGSTSPGANLIVWPCNGHADQNWDVIPAGNAPFNLNAPGCYVFQTSDGQVMAVSGGNMSNGTHVEQWPATHPTLDMAWCPTSF